jgi:hypothetical protein
VFQGFPRALQKNALLRINELGFFGAVAEKTRVKTGRIFHNRAPTDVIQSPGDLKGDPLTDNIFNREFRKTIHAGGQVRPVLFDICGPGKTAGKSDYRNTFEGIIL